MPPYCSYILGECALKEGQTSARNGILSSAGTADKNLRLKGRRSEDQ
jgi:hypothetical protein